MTTGHEIAMALRAAYLALHRQTNDCFTHDGVTADQFVLLAALAEADAVTQQELVRRIGSDPNTVRAMLLLLEGRDLVAREPHPADGRARSVTLTLKGRRACEKLWGKSEPLRAQLLAAFRPDEVTALVGLLQRVSEVMATATAQRENRTPKTGKEHGDEAGTWDRRPRRRRARGGADPGRRRGGAT
jgi:DNA-binding MarR family transcriptional regulator